MSILERFREKLDAAAFDAFLVTSSHNRRYLSGFKGSSGALLITPTQHFLITDSRYYERVKREAPDWTLVEAGSKTNEAINKLIPDINLVGAKIGFEADSVTVAGLNSMNKKIEGVEFVETSNFIMSLRAVKAASELDSIRQAVELADQAMIYIYDWIQPGMTEKEIAWELEVFMRSRGASALAFDTIVAAAENGASPHALVSDYQIQMGDPVVIDMGCIIDGYCSDITRSFSVGAPNQPDFIKVWDIVDQANAAAKKGIKVGMPSVEADALARDVIKAAGYGDNFGHSLGHGVGLAIHEDPKASYLSEEPLPDGSVVTIEPGIYLRGQFGVRLEDMVVLTADGVEVMTAAPKVKMLDR